ncbi:hypothetical protein [Alishewanella phage vB_AspM_Slicko01]|nr:hypothetical protein [Alishewanella phage vB_AspM_Slicko01]
MSVLSKFKIRKDLQKQIEKEEEKGGGYKKDDRFLPYYELKFNEKVKVLILPDTNGNLWKKYSSHGQNLKVRGTGTIPCRYKNSQESCPICQRGFDLLNQAKETGDTSFKDEAKRWFPKDFTVMSVLVLEAPFDVPISPDQNEVKLMHIPYAIEGLIKNALAEGQLDEDSILTTPLWIKKTIKKGTKDTPDYTSSYFDYRSPVSDEEIEIFDDSIVEAYDYDDLDAIPESPTEEDADVWLAKAIELDEKEKARKSPTHGGDSGDSGGNATKLKSAADRLKEKRAQSNSAPVSNSQDEVEEEEEDEVEEEVVEEKPTATKSKAQQLREKLEAARNR